jgi:PEP-CTERM motif
VNLPYGPISFVSGNLSGLLADGTPISNVPFARNLAAAGGLRGVIVLAAPVPEPSALLLSMFGFVGWLATFGRRRSTQA